MDPLLTALNKIGVLPPPLQALFVGAWQSWQVPKDHFLLREQGVCDYIFFIRKGAARIYYHKKGKEITEWFAMDEEFCFSIVSFFERQPSRLIIQALEPSEVMGIHYNDLNRLAAAHHEIETLYRKMLAASLILSQHRMDSIQFETAQQRYESLLRNYPQLVQRVPLTYIASFLGITLETLSRIRSSN